MFSNNPQRESHMRAGMAQEEDRGSEHTVHKPHIHIHHAGGKVHVHVMHHDQEPEVHEHDDNDHEGIVSHVHEHYGTDEAEDQSGLEEGDESAR